MKARVTIFYKDSVFDPQGNTVAHSLKRAGFDGVSDVRMGKVIDISFNQADSLDEQVRKMCDQLLVNPVIESYTYEILE